MTKDKSDEKSTNSPSTPLKHYKQHKKTLTPPLAALPNMVLTSWTHERMPDMLWATLIRTKHKGEMGYAIFRDILNWLAKNVDSNTKIEGITHTAIAGMPPKLRYEFIKHVADVAGTDALRPLLLFKDLPDYAGWLKVLESKGAPKPDPEVDWRLLADAVHDNLFHQTQEATDVRWIKVMGMILTGNIHITENMRETFENILEYPNKGDQRHVRPSIRSLEMTFNMADGSQSKWPNNFWETAYKNTACIPDVDTDKIKAFHSSVSDDKKYYDKHLQDVRQALIDHFFATLKTTRIDAKHEAVMGIALYAIDTFIENSILLTGSTVSGRATARIVFESYVTLAYMTHRETGGEPLWDTYRDYGSGQISLIERKYEEEKYKSSMVDMTTMDNIANEDKWSEYVPINLGNWDTSDLRTISTVVGEKDLYDKYYPYTSGFIHANWGAIRESSMQTCFNPLHRLHMIPSYGLPILPSVNEDCRQILNKILKLVDELYPTFKHQIPKRPVGSKSQKKGEPDGNPTSPTEVKENERKK